ncbi:restriction endonuclease fold toxin 5 domain-containing protein, partial [Janibacter corallicola]|uniref:restriction endonuclease fold toxin 5 domain-containing protein n=1 Tax=Janibacter corallicola TaxID=415212 RepID=UPI000AE8D6A9
ADGVAAHARAPGQSRSEALRDGRAFWRLQRQARQLACHVDADGHVGSGLSLAARFRLVGAAVSVVLLALGLVVAPWLADVIGPDLTTDDSLWWLAGQLDGLAQWWDGLSPAEQIAIGVAAGAVLAVPFGLGGGLFAAGVGTYVAEHGTGLGDLIEDPEAAVADYAASATPAGVLLDVAELGLTFIPPAAGAVPGTIVRGGVKQAAREYRAVGPADFWAGRRAAMREAPEAGHLRFGDDLPRPTGYPEWVTYPKKPRGRLPADFEPGWAAVAQGEKGMAYQEQITGVGRLPDGRVPEYVVKNPDTDLPVSFDGRTLRGDPPHEVFLDAKDGYADLASNPGRPWTRGMKDGILDAAKRQTDALPEGAVLEWKVSDPRGADAIQKLLDDEKFFNIDVEYVPKG